MMVWWTPGHLTCWHAQVLKRKIKAYIPDFKLAFEHVCIHTGGRGVVEEIEKQLSMTPELMQPSKDTLFRYGNTSSSSIWCAYRAPHSPVLLAGELLRHWLGIPAVLLCQSMCYL